MPKKIEYTDDTPFPFGKYYGQPMQDVPAWYLIDMYDNNRLSQPLRDYVEDNKEVLEQEIKEDEQV